MSRTLLVALVVFLSLALVLTPVFSHDVELDQEVEEFEMDQENAVIMAEINSFAEAVSTHEEDSASTDASLQDEDMSLLEVEESEGVEAQEGDDDDEEKPEHPTYVLPYPPVLPGHYTPLFNPYTNVNPLSTPFANYAAQPGAHPGVAAAAAAQAGSLAAVNGQIAGAAGGYPYYPYAARSPVIAGQLAGNPIPFSGYAGWIHPQNLNSAAVGDNEPEEFPQFVEVATEEGVDVEDLSCNGCEYN